MAHTDVDMSTAMVGLSRLVSTYDVSLTRSGHLQPEFSQFAMQPNFGPLELQFDSVTPEGFFQIQWSELILRMRPWVTGSPRNPEDSGTQGDLRVPARTFQSTVWVRSNELFPLMNAFPTQFQIEQLSHTAASIAEKLRRAEMEDRVDLILDPIVQNTFKTWDDEFLISENHEHTDRTRFSNQLLGGVQVAFRGVGTIPPTRVDVTDPALTELFDEMSFIAAHFSAIAQSVHQFQKVPDFQRFEVIVKDDATLQKFQDLNRLLNGRLVDPLASENTPNRFFGSFSITRDRNLLTGAGSDRDYFVVPALGELSPTLPADPLPEFPGLPATISVEPRPVMFIEIRGFQEVDTDWKRFDFPQRARMGIWTRYAYEGAFGETIVRFRPA